jgi:hypothetical protein
MRIIRGRVICVALGLAMLAGPALAAAIPDEGLTLGEVATWLQRSGYKAEVKGSGEKATLASAADGLNFEIEMYDCVAGRCKSMQFGASFDFEDAMTLDRANEWNLKKRYAKVYIDDTGDPIVQYDVNLSPGGSYEALDDDFGVWRMMMSDFADFIGW